MLNNAASVEETYFFNRTKVIQYIRRMETILENVDFLETSSYDELDFFIFYLSMAPGMFLTQFQKNSSEKGIGCITTG